MFFESPSKLVIYYHEKTDCVLVRLIDKDWNDIIRYDTLPPFCNLSDFRIEIEEVKTFSEETGEVTQILVNDMYLFTKFSDDRTTLDVPAKGGIVEHIKDLFNVTSTV